MADGFAITFAAFQLERDLLFAADVLDHVGHNGGVGHCGGADRELALIAHQQDAIESYRLPGFDRQPLDFQGIAGADPILFASGFYY